MAVPKLYLVLMAIKVNLYLGSQTVHEEARTREKPASSTAKVAEMDEGGGCPHPQKTQPRSLVRKSFSQIWPKKELILQMLGFAMKMLGKSKGDFPFHGDLMVIYIPWDPESVKHGPEVMAYLPIIYTLEVLGHHFLQVGLRVSPFL